MSEENICAGMAALSICESLMLALNEAQVLPESKIIGVLKDAATSHENAHGTNVDIKAHKAAVALINQVIAGANSVRRH